MPPSPSNLSNLRKVITENLRIQERGPISAEYIDTESTLEAVRSKQNHVIFARRGSGKTLLLHHSARTLSKSVKSIYINCEDFKHHSFPKVLIEILDRVFINLESYATWTLIGKRRKAKIALNTARKKIDEWKSQPDEQTSQVTTSDSAKSNRTAGITANVGPKHSSLAGSLGELAETSTTTQRVYSAHSNKLGEIQDNLPLLKSAVCSFFDGFPKIEAIFLQIDDFYHLPRITQPEIIDYIHRLCKDVPFYFKLATLRHSSNLFSERDGQPIGVQMRHDFQPVDINYSFADFDRTASQNRAIFDAYGVLSGMSTGEIFSNFKGEGFDRLIIAGGGVPRDCLSLFLDALSQAAKGDGRIGKDEVRQLSRTNFIRRIDELKQDSQGSEQALLIKGAYLLRAFCLNRGSNVMLISEEEMQNQSGLCPLLNRLLDYRIIHAAGSALTRKSGQGTFQAFVIDIGCYAHFRKLTGRIEEIKLSGSQAREEMRSSPVLEMELLEFLWSKIPTNYEAQMASDAASESEL